MTYKNLPKTWQAPHILPPRCDTYDHKARLSCVKNQSELSPQTIENVLQALYAVTQHHAIAKSEQYTINAKMI